MKPFVGANVRLARLFHNLSLAELGERVGCSKQFLSRVETGAEVVSLPLQEALAAELLVLPEFFAYVDAQPITEEQCHFRKQLTTKAVLRQQARARGEVLKRLVGELDERLELPAYAVEEGDPSSIDGIERSAERARSQWGLGLGPISNMTRVAENAGAVVMRVNGLAHEVDAVSFATRRPVIALNGSGRSSCRARFGVAHEVGHFALHVGVLTGDRLTEQQANRFASAFLMPRSTFISECRLGLRGSRLNWQGLSALKLRWGVSKAALLYRGSQLGVFSSEQAKSGYIHLKRHGEAIQETEDHLVPAEQPEVVTEGLKVLRDHFGLPEPAVARAMHVRPEFLSGLMSPDHTTTGANVVALTRPA